MTELSPEGYHVPKYLISSEQAMEDLRVKLTMKPICTFDTCLSSEKRFYIELDDKFIVPKFFGLRRFGVPSKLTIPNGKDINIEFNGSLLSEQQAPVEAFMEKAISLEFMGGIISLQCGAGKTVIALFILSKLKKKTLIIVHKEFLLSQWHARIQQFLPTASIGLIKAGVVDVSGRDIVMASLQSLSMKIYDPSVFSDFGFVIIDECHRVGTEIFSKALAKINFRYTLGLSATVERKDGMTDAFINYIGNVVQIDERKKENCQKFPRVYVKIIYFKSSNLAYNKEEILYRSVFNKRSGAKEFVKSFNLSLMINNICDHEPRSLFIVDMVKDILIKDPNRKVLILSDRKSQLTTILRLLSLTHTTGFYWGGMKPDELRESEEKQIICATFSYAAEGMDIPGLDTLVLASPKSDIEQSCGRIMRRVNEYQPYIIDIVDSFCPIFIAQSKKRKAFYTRNKYSFE